MQTDSVLLSAVLKLIDHSPGSITKGTRVFRKSGILLGRYQAYPAFVPVVVPSASTMIENRRLCRATPAPSGSSSIFTGG